MKARELDIRASPYDLTAYKVPNNFSDIGFQQEPIKVETIEVDCKIFATYSRMF